MPNGNRYALDLPEMPEGHLAGERQGMYEDPVKGWIPLPPATPELQAFMDAHSGFPWGAVATFVAVAFGGPALQALFSGASGTAGLVSAAQAAESAGAIEGGTTLAANLGGAGALGAGAWPAIGVGVPAVEGGATLAANLGGAGAISAPAFAPAAALGPEGIIEGLGGPGGVAETPGTVGGVELGGAAASVAGSAPSWLSGSLLPVGIQAGAGLLGAALQARAAGKATEAQLKYLREALAYEKERDRYGYATEANRYAALMGETAPYRATGVASNARMADLLGLPGPPTAAPEAPPPTYPTPSLPGVTAPAGTAVPRGQPPGSVPMGPGGSVMMRAPDGSQQQVPREFVEHYTQRGATVIGGA